MRAVPLRGGPLGTEAGGDTEGDKAIRIDVIDNGVEIEPANLQRVFNHGFTTKPNGHGFGLHASALTAQQLRGSITAHCDGLGCGARFTVLMPIQAAAS